MKDKPKRVLNIFESRMVPPYPIDGKHSSELWQINYSRSLQIPNVDVLKKCSDLNETNHGNVYGSKKGDSCYTSFVNLDIPFLGLWFAKHLGNPIEAMPMVYI
jgi:hypothetical protein